MKNDVQIITLYFIYILRCPSRLEGKRMRNLRINKNIDT